MNQGVINLTLQQMALSYTFIIIAIILTSLNGINRNKEIIINVIRMTVQLTVAGFILVYIFDSKSFIFTCLMLIFMEASAIYNIIKPRVKILPRSLFVVIILAILISSLASLLFFILLVIRPKPLYNPQYLIPIGGMIIGNTMNGISLALMPTLNSMKNMGLITLPGMMTGQILGGVVPTIAIKYQIAIMTTITSSVAIGVFIFLKFSTKKFFNEEKQLINLNK